MKRIRLAAGAAMLCGAALAVQAAGLVEVEFVEPARYTDAGRIELERRHTLELIGAHLRSLGERLPDGQVLRLAVLDIDLAGEIQPGVARDQRVLVGGTDAPRMHLRYTLQSGGRTLQAGEVRLADLDYLHTKARRPVSELAYDRMMLDRWFDANFAAPR
jgi:hypothetical protein